MSYALAIDNKTIRKPVLIGFLITITASFVAVSITFVKKNKLT